MSEYERITFVINCRGAGVGPVWSLNGITATPAAQASGDRYKLPSSVTRMPPVWTAINQIPRYAWQTCFRYQPE